MNEEVRIVIVQGVGEPIVFDSCGWSGDKPIPITKPLPIQSNDLKEMVFGVLPTTSDIDATKLHILPSSSFSIPSSTTNSTTATNSAASQQTNSKNNIVILSKLFVCKSTLIQQQQQQQQQPPPTATPQNSQQQQKPQMPQLLRKITMAIAIILSGEHSIGFIGGHFLVVDVRLCKAVRRIREHNSALLTAAIKRTQIAFQQSFQKVPLARRSPSLGPSLLFAGVISSSNQTSNSTSTATTPTPQNRGLLSLQEDDIIGREINSLVESIKSLYFGPRLSNSLWTQMMLRGVSSQQMSSKDDKQNELLSPGRKLLMKSTPEAEKLMEKLLKLEELDSSRSNNFVSASVTAVLGCHRAWVSSISDRNNALVSSTSDNSSTMFRNFLSKQLWDLQGGPLGGSLSRVVVVCGENCDPEDEEEAELLLEILSFFIRSPGLILNSTKKPQPKQTTNQNQQSDIEIANGSQETTVAATIEEEIPFQQQQQAVIVQEREGAELESVPISECEENIPEIQEVESEGPGITLFGRIYDSFRADLSLLGVKQSLPIVLASIAEELRFEWELHGDFLVEGDVPSAVVCDMGSRTVEIVSISPNDIQEFSEEDGEGGYRTRKQQIRKQSVTDRVLKPLSPSSFGSPSLVDNPIFKQRGNNNNDNVTEGITRSEVFPSAHILEMLSVVRNLSVLGASSDSCIMFLEDKLHELLSMAKVAVERLRVASNVPSQEQLEADLQLGAGDLRLIASLIRGSRRWPLVRW